MNKKISRALVSVSDKTGLVEFCSILNQLGIEILSTGGTAKTLTEHGLPVSGAWSQRKATDVAAVPVVISTIVFSSVPAFRLTVLILL